MSANGSPRMLLGRNLPILADLLDWACVKGIDMRRAKKTREWR